MDTWEKSASILLDRIFQKWRSWDLPTNELIAGHLKHYQRCFGESWRVSYGPNVYPPELKVRDISKRTEYRG